jgi:cell division septation protein DedD
MRSLLQLKILAGTFQFFAAVIDSHMLRVASPPCDPGKATDMTLPSIPRKLLLGMSLIFLVAGGCKERQEPAPPKRPAVVRKTIEAPPPVTVQAVKPDDQEPPARVTEEAPPKTEAQEPLPLELAEVKPPAEEQAPAPEVTVEPEEVIEEPDREAETVASAEREYASVQEIPPGKKMPPVGAFRINVASFRQKQSADRYVEELKKKGIDAFSWEVNLGEKGRWYRVSVGGFPTLDEAKNYVKELRQKGIPDTYITKITESS